MNKRDYLVKTFSRTKRKDYENYIITAIWHKLDNMELKPVSQQYVKLKKGNYALMDLYFPQISIGVEVDESYHQGIQEEDKLRMNDIISAVNEESNKDFKYLRIDASMSIELINNKIDEVVSIIKEEASRRNLKWLTYEDELKQIQQQEFLSIYDDVSFKVIKDIANNIFGKNSMGYRTCGIKINDNLYLWCPKLSVVIDGNPKSIANGWLNILAEDWSYIDVSQEDQTEVERRKSLFDEDRERVVFAKYKDNLGYNRYRFVGIFQRSGLSPEDERFIRYIRINDNIKIVRKGPCIEGNMPN